MIQLALIGIAVGAAAYHFFLDDKPKESGVKVPDKKPEKVESLSPAPKAKPKAKVKPKPKEVAPPVEPTPPTEKED